jgi:hypothetical protein
MASPDISIYYKKNRVSLNFSHFGFVLSPFWSHHYHPIDVLSPFWSHHYHLIATPAFLAANKSPNKSRVFSKLSS